MNVDIQHIDESNNTIQKAGLFIRFVSRVTIFLDGRFVGNVIVEDKGQPWDLMDIMNNVTSVHNCVEHQNQKCGIGTAFDSLNREK